MVLVVVLAGGGLREGVLLDDAHDDEQLDGDELEGDAGVFGALVGQRGLPEDEEAPVVVGGYGWVDWCSPMWPGTMA